jgi:hypothetical protein
MVHSGYEATAVNDAISHPLKVLAKTLAGSRTDGPMAPEIPLDRQRPAKYVYSSHVQKMLDEIDTPDAGPGPDAKVRAKEPIVAK